MIELNVKDMTCGRVSAVTRALTSVDPEARVEVELEIGRVRFAGRGSASELTRALAAAGYAADVSTAQRPAVPAKKGCCCS